VSLSPAVLLTLGTAVVPVVALRLVPAGSAAPPEAVGTVAALAFAAATAAMLADDAAFALAPVAASPARRALQRALVASLAVGGAMVAVSAVARIAWPAENAVDVAACIALAVTAGVVTALVRPTGSRDGATAALAGILAAMGLIFTPVAVGGLGPIGGWIETVMARWSTDPWWWTLGVLALAILVLRRR
jgi:hypothetical protein